MSMNSTRASGVERPLAAADRVELIPVSADGVQHRIVDQIGVDRVPQHVIVLRHEAEAQ